MSGFPVAGEGYIAELTTDKCQLRLFAENYPLGHVAVVFDVTAKVEILREDADDFDAAKRQAEEGALRFLKAKGAQVPEIQWQMNSLLRQRMNR